MSELATQDSRRRKEERRYSTRSASDLYDTVSPALRTALCGAPMLLNALDALRELELRARELKDRASERSEGR